MTVFITYKHVWLSWMADYLVIPENMAPSEVIIVLGGEKKGERTERAVALYQQGLAPRLLFSDGTSLSWRARAVDEMVALAQVLGVPSEAIFTEEQSVSTYTNAVYTRQILEKNGWDSAIVVTTAWHSRRASMVFHQVYEGSGIRLTFAVAKDKRFAGLDDWWLDPEKQQVVLTEWAKLLVYRVRY